MFSSKDAAARATRLHYIMFFLIRDAKMGRPAHATWYVPRLSLPPALQALTYRLGAPAHPCNVRACSHPRTLPLGRRGTGIASGGNAGF